MIKKVITFEDIDGEQATEEYHFGLSKADLVEMKFFHRKDLMEYVEGLIKSEDGGEIISIFRDILMRSVGKRDGKRFIKTQDIRDEFEQTGAYSAMLMELLQSENSGADFIAGILPADLAKQVEEQQLPKEYTHDELVAMSDEEFARVAGTDRRKMTREHLIAAMERKNKAA